MGLDIVVLDKLGESIDSFRAGSYSGFGEWREILAKEVGFDLNDMLGFGGKKKWKKDTPFSELLSHSDCDGELSLDECKNLLKDFNSYLDDKMDKRKMIIFKLENTNNDALWFLEKMKEWRIALKEAVDKGGKLVFC